MSNDNPTIHHQPEEDVFLFFLMLFVSSSLPIKNPNSHLDFCKSALRQCLLFYSIIQIILHWTENQHWSCLNAWSSQKLWPYVQQFYTATTTFEKSLMEIPSTTTVQCMAQYTPTLISFWKSIPPGPVCLEGTKAIIRTKPQYHSYIYTQHGI